MARIEINEELCMNSGQCAYMQPTLFALDPNGKPTVLAPEPNAEQMPGVEEAIEICPSQAISLIDG